MGARVDHANYLTIAKQRTPTAFSPKCVRISSFGAKKNPGAEAPGLETRLSKKITKSGVSFGSLKGLHHVSLGLIAKGLDSGLFSDFLGTVGLESNDLGTCCFSVFDSNRIFDIPRQ